MSPHSNHFAKARRRLFYYPIVSIILLWGLLYLPHLRSCPTWYGDETLAITAAQSLLENTPSHRAVWNSFWHPYAPYQPGYLYAIGAGMSLFGGDILGARFVNTLIGLLTALVVFLGLRRLIGTWGALASALWLLSYEQAIIHYRWTFTHNLIGLGFAWSFLLLCKKPSKQVDWLAGGGFALGFCALPLAIYGPVAGGVIRWNSPKSWVPLVLPSCLVIFSSFFLSLAFHYPYTFLINDLQAITKLYIGASEQNSGSFLGVFQNFIRFFFQDTWHSAGLLALLSCLFSSKIRPLAIGGLLVAILLVQNRQNLPLFYYQAMIFLPLMAAALGGSCLLLLRFLQRLCPCYLRGVKRLQRFLPFIPISMAIMIMPTIFSGKLTPRIAYWTTQSVPEVEAVARWVNEHTEKTDLVFSHQNIAWLLQCKTADYLQMATWLGYTTWPFDLPLPKEEFRYAPDIGLAKFAIIADIDRRWTFLQPNIAKALESQGIKSWPIRWQGENYIVLENPRIYFK